MLKIWTKSCCGVQDQFSVIFHINIWYVKKKLYMPGKPKISFATLISNHNYLWHVNWVCEFYCTMLDKDIWKRINRIHPKCHSVNSESSSELKPNFDLPTRHFHMWRRRRRWNTSLHKSLSSILPAGNLSTLSVYVEITNFIWKLRIWECFNPLGWDWLSLNCKWLLWNKINSYLNYVIKINIFCYIKH